MNGVFGFGSLLAQGSAWPKPRGPTLLARPTGWVQRVCVTPGMSTEKGPEQRSCGQAPTVVGLPGKDPVLYRPFCPPSTWRKTPCTERSAGGNDTSAPMKVWNPFHGLQIPCEGPATQTPKRNIRVLYHMRCKGVPFVAVLEFLALGFKTEPSYV